MSKTLPLVMPANLVKMAKELEQEFPNRIAVLFSPQGWEKPKGLPYSLDNGRFTVWSKGITWSRKEYKDFLRKASSVTYPPLWIAVPDVVANAKETVQEWNRWSHTLRKLQWPLALVVQDGMTIDDVHNLDIPPDYIFVGGSTKWKWRTIRYWCRNFDKVHIGRVNTGKKLWSVQEAGAISSDGTGWFHHKQKEQMIAYLKRSSLGKPSLDYGLGIFW